MEMRQRIYKRFGIINGALFHLKPNVQFLTLLIIILLIGYGHSQNAPDSTWYTQELIKTPFLPSNLTVVQGWAAFANKSIPPNYTPATITVDYWRLIGEDTATGVSTILYEEDYNTNSCLICNCPDTSGHCDNVYCDGALYARTTTSKDFSGWFDNTSSMYWYCIDCHIPLSNTTITNGFLTIDISKDTTYPYTISHWWTSTTYAKPSDKYYVEMRTKIDGQASLQVGTDFKNNTLDIDSESFGSDWYGDTHGNFILIRSPHFAWDTDNYMGKFDTEGKIGYWAFENAPSTLSQTTNITWLSTYQNHTGIMKISFSSASEGLKMSSYARFIPNTTNRWYRIRVTYFCDSVFNGDMTLATLLYYNITSVACCNDILYQNSTSLTIQEIGASYTGNSLIQSSTWNTLDSFVYCDAGSGQLQLFIRNKGSAGAMYIDSIELDNVAPPAYPTSNRINVSIPQGDFDTSNDTTSPLWVFESAPNTVNGEPQLSWLSTLGGQTGVLAFTFSNISQGIKMTSNLFSVPTGHNIIMSFKVRSSLSTPTSLQVFGFLYGEKSYSPFMSDIAGYVNVGIMPGNTWNTFYVPLNSASQQTALRLQLMMKNGNQPLEKIYLDDIQLFYSSTVGYDSSSVKINEYKNSWIELSLSK